MDVVIKVEKRKLFFTSDTHYGHANICRGTSTWTDLSGTRDFDEIEVMNQTIVDNINSVVGENDILIHLGDFSFGRIDNITKFREQLVCENIYLVLGNHDEHIAKNKNDLRSLFAHVDKTMTVEYKGEDGYKSHFFLSHYPIASWPNMQRGVYHLHGHVHLPPHLRVSDTRAMDVGVDGNGLKPIIVEDVIGILRNKPIANLILKQDHHL